MADEQRRWLDRGTAERLLNGEPPEAADPTTRDQAERLAGTLRALSAAPSSADGELPGEAAALAAFRKCREERRGQAGPDTATGAEGPDAGLVRLGAPRGDGSGTPGGRRPPRSLWLGLAATLVAGMVGGAAVLAGAGVLPTPSGDAGADPAVSVTAPPSERPLPPTPPDAGRATPEGRHPEATAGVEARPGADTGAGGRPSPGRSGPDSGDPAARSGRAGKQIASACRAWRDGEHLNGARKRLLEEEAGGPARVGPYCQDTLSSGGGSATTARGDTGAAQGGEAEGNGKGHEKKNENENENKGEGDGGKTDGSDKRGQGSGQGKGSGNTRGNTP